MFSIIFVLILVITLEFTTQKELFDDDFQKIIGEKNDFFGWAVDVSGNFAIVGASINYRDLISGKAYIYEYDGSKWTQQQILQPKSLKIQDEFGCSVAIEGKNAVVGSCGYNNFQGSAYTFRFNGKTWEEVDMLVSEKPSQGSEFGNSVSLSGDFLIVGSYLSNEKGFNSGVAYVYHYDGTNWKEYASLTGSDTVTFDNFGYSVSISGETAIVGSIGNRNIGAAYVFKFDGKTWKEEQKIISVNASKFDEFGTSVSIDQDNMIISDSSINDERSHDSFMGKVYIYHNEDGEWKFKQVLIPSSKYFCNCNFGEEISIYGKNAVIGLQSADDTHPGHAFIYSLEKETWVLKNDLKDPEAKLTNSYGKVAISDKFVVVGDNFNKYDKEKDEMEGAVFFYSNLTL